MQTNREFLFRIGLVGLMIAGMAQAAPKPDNPTTFSTQSSLDKHLSEARQLARNHAKTDIASSKWFWGGLYAGTLTNLPGTVTLSVIASTMPTDPPLSNLALIQDKSVEYQMAYLSTYKSHATSRRVGPAFTGGLAGSLISGLALVVLILAVT